MLWRKKKKDHTPEEYRDKAQEQIQDLMRQEFKLGLPAVSLILLPKPNQT